MRIQRLIVAALALVATPAPGCRKDIPIVRVRDSEGRRLLAKCGEKGCEVRQKEGPEWPAEAPNLVLWDTGLLVSVCNTPKGVSQAEDARYCRPLECDDDRSCPPDPGSERGHCINGLCVDPAGTLTPDDAIVLCLAGTGLGVGAAEQVEGHAMGVNCGSPCVVPRTCRQP